MAIFSVQETYEKVIVEVTLTEAPKGLRNRNKEAVTKSDVLIYLKKLGVEHGTCTQQAELSNFGDSPNLSGFFVFDSCRPKIIANSRNAEVKKKEVSSKDDTQDLPKSEEVTKVSRKGRGKRAKSEKKAK